MASTYTSNINLEKPATGDQVDSWGPTVNTNMDTIDTNIANKLPLAGGAMTGPITTNSTFDGVDIATRDAVLTTTTTTANAALPKAGGTMTGNIVMSGTETVDGVDISARDAILTSTTTTANAALPKAGGIMTGEVEFQNHFAINDNKEIRVGSGNDLKLYHDASHSYIAEVGTGDLNISSSDTIHFNNAAGVAMAKFWSAGAAELYHNGTKMVETTADGVGIPDNKKLELGDGDDLQIWHETTNNHSIIRENGGGHLKLQAENLLLMNAAATETYIECVHNADVQLYYDNTYTAGTTSNGWIIKANKDLTMESGTWTGETAGKIQRHSTHMYFQIPDAGSWIFRNQSGNEYLNIAASSGALTSSNNITAYSDIRLKKDIKTIENALDKVSKLRGVEYTRKSNDEREIGVIAQEVKEIVPELVTIQESDNSLNDSELKDIHTMKYQNTVGLLIEAIKDLKAEVDELKEKKCKCEEKK